MALVQYSDSESEEDTTSLPPPAKKPRQDQQPTSSLPPLPTTFHDLYASTTRVSVQDDPSLHGGRKRAIPHVEGNWPTHLYLEWHPPRHELKILQKLIVRSSELSSSKFEIHSLLHSDLGAQLPLHISLSRPVVLRTEQRASFAESLEKEIEKSQIEPFDVESDGLRWVSNYERTRWFLVLHIQRPENNNLNRLLHLCNRTLARFNQPPLYASERDTNQQSNDFCDKFHISLAWALTEPSEEENRYVADMSLRPVKYLRVRFDNVKVKIGNNVSSVPLSTES